MHTACNCYSPQTIILTMASLNLWFHLPKQSFLVIATVIFRYSTKVSKMRCQTSEIAKFIVHIIQPLKALAQTGAEKSDIEIVLARKKMDK